MAQKYRELSKFESCPHTFASTEYSPLLQILSFGVISQKSEFFVKNGLNKLFYVLKVYLYIKIYIEFKIIFITRFYGSSCAVFVWGENLELLGFLVVVGGYLKKRCFIAFVVSCKNPIQTGFEHERLKG